jgi:hypothetical protein
MPRKIFLVLSFFLIQPVFAATPEAKDGFFKTSDGVRLHYASAAPKLPLGWQDQNRETNQREPPMVNRSSSTAITKSGVPSAFTSRVRAW